jgi:cytochrome c oxidase cbb3-type subunit 3
MPSMPPISLTDDDIVAVAEYLHAVQATARGQGSPPAGPPVQLNIVVGDPKAGEVYFTRTCTACHSAQGMQGIASRIPDPMQLQNTWVAGGAVGARGGGRPTPRVTAVVTLANGQRLEGLLVRVDDFIVAIEMPDGTQRSFARTGEVPGVEVRDPRQAHWNLLPTHTDTDMHNVTAYLATLK